MISDPWGDLRELYLCSGHAHCRFAHRCGITPRRLSRLMTLRNAPTVAELTAVARALGKYVYIADRQAKKYRKHFDPEPPSVVFRRKLHTFRSV